MMLLTDVPLRALTNQSPPDTMHFSALLLELVALPFYILASATT